VIDLKADTKVKSEHERQVLKYMESLRKQLKDGESVHSQGMVINFAKQRGGESKGPFYKEQPKIRLVERKAKKSRKPLAGEQRGRNDISPG
jgi:uncharacterized protein (UPF0128 family)